MRGAIRAVHRHDPANETADDMPQTDLWLKCAEDEVGGVTVGSTSEGTETDNDKGPESAASENQLPGADQPTHSKV